MEILMGMASASALFFIFSHIPICSYSSILKKYYSPKLIIAKKLGFTDGILNLFVILGSLVGLMTVTGIGMIIHNCIMVLSLSVGILIIKKFMIPRWEQQFEQAKQEYITDHSL